MMFQYLAQAAPSLVKAGFALGRLLRKPKPRRFEEVHARRSEMLARRASEGLMSRQQERQALGDLFEKLIRLASEETDVRSRATFGLRGGGGETIARARLLTQPFQKAREQLTGAKLRLQAGELQAAKEAGEQWGAEEEGFRKQEEARVKAEKASAMQDLAGGLGSLPGSIMREVATRKLEGLSLDDMRQDPGKLLGTLGRLGMRLPYGFSSLLRKPEAEELPTDFGEILDFGERGYIKGMNWWKEQKLDPDDFWDFWADFWGAQSEPKPTKPSSNFRKYQGGMGIASPKDFLQVGGR